MVTLIKKLLREHLAEAEFDKSGHSVERIKQRIASIPDSDLSFNVKEVIFYNLDKIQNTDFSTKKTFTIMLGKFKPDPNSNLYVTDEKGRGYYRIWTDEVNSEIKDSTGDEFWMIIRNNIIQTVFLRKSWQTQNADLNSEKLRVDYTFKNVDQAISQLGKKLGKEESIEPIVIINGVKWVVDSKNETMYKKNKPTEIHNISDVLDQVDEPTQEKILSFL
jgi:hypothetical protein